MNFSADLFEPGRVRFFGPGDFFVGEIDGTVTTRVRDLAGMLSAWGRVEVTDNIWGYLWSKLAYGAMLYATALVDADQADIIDRYRPLMIDLAAEICEVALKEGVRLLSFHGFEPNLYCHASDVTPRASKRRRMRCWTICAAIRSHAVASGGI